MKYLDLSGPSWKGDIQREFQSYGSYKVSRTLDYLLKKGFISELDGFYIVTSEGLEGSSRYFREYGEFESR